MSEGQAVNRYAVTIPDWTEGCPLRCSNIEAASPEEAIAKIVAWVNGYAGHQYCEELPLGTKVEIDTDTPRKPRP